MRLISQCPVCNKKNAVEVKHSNLGNTRFITLDCGHTYFEDLVVSATQEDKPKEIYLRDNRKLYPFQVAGVEFIETSNFRCQISDEMGLGKTIQAIAAIDRHFDDLAPVLVVCKASLTYNWAREIILGTKRLVQVYESGDKIIPGIKILIVSYDTLTPRKIRGKEHEIDEKNLATIKAFKAKTVIVDECQMIKNHNAKRTNALREIIRRREIVSEVESISKPRIEMIAKDLMKYHGLEKRFELKFASLDPGILGMAKCRVTKDGIIVGEIIISRHHAEKGTEDEIIETILHEIAHAITPGAGHKPIWCDTSKAIGGNGQAFAWCEGSREIESTELVTKHVISLSGTPIKNNAIEYFPILNILRPEMFPNLDLFERQHVDYYWNGRGYKAGGLRYPDHFHEKTKDFIIRRLRKEVLPDLPKIQRDYKYYPLSNEVKKAYGKRVKDLENFLDNTEDTGNQYFTDLLAHLAKLRHITGIAKIEPTLDFLSEFIEENADSENGKIVVFHHHIDVGDILAIKIPEIENSGVIRMTAADPSEVRMQKIDSFRENPNFRVMLIPTLAGGEGINLQFCHHAILLEREWNPANEEQAEGRFSRIGSDADKIIVTYPVATGTIDEYFAEIVETKREIVGKTLDGVATKWNESEIMRELAEKVVTRWRP